MSLVYPSNKLKCLYKSRSENKVVQNCLKHIASSLKPKLCLSQSNFSNKAAKVGEEEQDYELVAG